MDTDEVKKFLIDLIEEEFSPTPCEIAPKWMDGVIKIEPGNDTQGKELPVEVLFKKILTVRDSLRVLEQKINTNKDISQSDKASYQAYITKAYGSLTTFNVLFKDGKDRFQGAGSGGSGGGVKKRDQMSVADAKKKLGLNEY